MYYKREKLEIDFQLLEPRLRDYLAHVRVGITADLEDKDHRLDPIKWNFCEDNSLNSSLFVEAFNRASARIGAYAVRAESAYPLSWVEIDVPQKYSHLSWLLQKALERFVCRYLIAAKLDLHDKAVHSILADRAARLRAEADADLNGALSLLFIIYQNL